MLNDYYDYTSIYGYIYLTRLPDLRFYIGQKKGKPIVENYYGSNKHLDNWFMKHIGAHSNRCPKALADAACVERIILDYALDQDELDWLEIHYIAEYKDRDIYNECFNIHPGGQSSYFKPKGKFKLTQEQKEKAIKTKAERRAMGLYKVTEETRLKMSIGIKKAKQLKPSWNKGLTKETSPIIANAVKNRKPPKITEETRKGHSKATKGKLWWNNGIEQVRAYECPEGWQRGMLDWKGDKKIEFSDEHRAHLSESRRNYLERKKETNQSKESK